ncbi:uncharacterized protein [Mobula birostris]|uniref:uncharacterized protein isoform X2 n=1 Tax=Mobula birostris TaxID=1983395 RepID=UPI003B288B2E
METTEGICIQGFRRGCGKSADFSVRAGLIKCGRRLSADSRRFSTVHSGSDGVWNGCPPGARHHPTAKYPQVPRSLCLGDECRICSWSAWHLPFHSRHQLLQLLLFSDCCTEPAPSRQRRTLQRCLHQGGGEQTLLSKHQPGQSGC